MVVVIADLNFSLFSFFFSLLLLEERFPNLQKEKRKEKNSRGKFSLDRVGANGGIGGIK